MIEQAELRGEIRPGHTTLVESSSGNTAIAIAMVAAIKGYHFMPVVDIKMPKGKLDLLRIFGADVQQVGDPTIPPEEQRCPAPGPRTNPTHRVASSDLFIGRGTRLEPLLRSPLPSSPDPCTRPFPIPPAGRRSRRTSPRCRRRPSVRRGASRSRTPTSPPPPCRCEQRCGHLVS